MTTEERITRIEKATLLMQELVLHEERLDDFGEKSRQSREEFDFKMNALIDAQIKLEESVRALEKTSQSLERASRSQLKRIENLEQI